MTVASKREGRIENHRQSAQMHEEFADLAASDGKIHIERLHRSMAEGHRSKADCLRGSSGAEVRNDA
jgi:hypothetical protein